MTLSLLEKLWKSNCKLLACFWGFGDNSDGLRGINVEVLLFLTLFILTFYYLVFFTVREAH